MRKSCGSVAASHSAPPTVAARLTDARKYKKEKKKKERKTINITFVFGGNTECTMLYKCVPETDSIE